MQSKEKRMILTHVRRNPITLSIRQSPSDRVLSTVGAFNITDYYCLFDVLSTSS
jgi:hypothetical protein